MPRATSIDTGTATLNDMLRAADRLQAGEAIPADLEPELLQGTSIGGARPKATLVDGGRELIAKFSSTTDPYPVVKSAANDLPVVTRDSDYDPLESIGGPQVIRI